MLDFLFFQPPLCNMILGMWLRLANQRGLCQALWQKSCVTLDKPYIFSNESFASYKGLYKR